MVSLITLFGAVDGAGVLTRTLSTDAGATRARPVDAGNLLDEQLRASTPLDAYTWSQLSDATVIRLLPGMEGGLDPALARTLSGATHGLVLALEAVRTRDRYLVGSFLSGRTVEYSSSIEGIASGPLGARLADDEVPAEIFTAWLEAVLGPDVVPIQSFGSEPEGALLAPPWHLAREDKETPLCRIAVRDQAGRVRVEERPGSLLTVQLADLPNGAARATLGLGAGDEVPWAFTTGKGARTAGTANGQLELAAALPTWAFVAPSS